MTAIMKNDEVFIKYCKDIVPVDIPHGTITWRFSCDCLCFALEDRIIIESRDIDETKEFMMDNKGIISFYVHIHSDMWDYTDDKHPMIFNCLIRFFDDKIITNIRGEEGIIQSTIGQKLKCLANIDVTYNCKICTDIFYICNSLNKKLHLY